MRLKQGDLFNPGEAILALLSASEHIAFKTI